MGLGRQLAVDVPEGLVQPVLGCGGQQIKPLFIHGGDKQPDPTQVEHNIGSVHR